MTSSSKRTFIVKIKSFRQKGIMNKTGNFVKMISEQANNVGRSALILYGIFVAHLVIAFD